MGNRKWSSEEQASLAAAVAKHGTGKWKKIKDDPQFSSVLGSKSTAALKDKWRYMNTKRNQDQQTSASAAGAADFAPVHAQPSTSAAPAADLGSVHAQPSGSSAPEAHPRPVNASPAPAAQNGPADAATDDSQRYYAGIVYEAILTLQPNNSNATSIANYIEQRHKVPENFRRSIGSRLRRLVTDGKIKKVENCYQIKENKLEAKEEAPLNLGQEATIKRAAADAAQKIAIAEHANYLASQAVKAVDRLSTMVGEAKIILQVAENIYQECYQGRTD